MTTPNIVLREHLTLSGDIEYFLVAVFSNEELYLRRVSSDHKYEMRNILHDFVEYGDYDVENITVSCYRRMIGDERQNFFILHVCYDSNNVLKAYSGFDEIFTHELRAALTDLVYYMKGESNV